MAKKTDYIKKAQIRASSVLTTAYVAATILTDSYKYNQLMIYIDLTKGSITSMEWKVEFSHDNVSWYQESVEDLSEMGKATSREIEHQIVAANQSASKQLYRFVMPITDRYIKISAKGIGTMTNSLLVIDTAFGIS